MERERERKKERERERKTDRQIERRKQTWIDCLLLNNRLVQRKARLELVR